MKASASALQELGGGTDHQSARIPPERRRGGRPRRGPGIVATGAAIRLRRSAKPVAPETSACPAPAGAEETPIPNPHPSITTRGRTPGSAGPYRLCRVHCPNQHLPLDTPRSATENSREATRGLGPLRRVQGSRKCACTAPAGAVTTTSSAVGATSCRSRQGRESQDMPTRTAVGMAPGNLCGSA